MKHQLFAITLCLSAFNSYAEEVEIYIPEINKKTKSEVPIDVDITNATLCINLNDAIEAYVVVMGPDGVVYQQNISPKTYRTIKIDLMQYQDGDYTITFYSTDGEVLEGAFFLYKPQITNVF